MLKGHTSKKKSLDPISVAAVPHGAGGKETWSELAVGHSSYCALC